MIFAKTSSVISPTTTSLEPSGKFALKSADVATSVAFAFAVSLTLSTEAPLYTSTSPVAVGKTTTGTTTLSVNSPLLYVTGMATSFVPGSAVILASKSGSPLVPFVPGVTATFTSSSVNSSSSNLTILFAVDPITVTGTSTSLVSTTLLLASLYSTTTFAGVWSPIVVVPGRVPAFTSLIDTVTPVGILSVAIALAASFAFSFTKFSKLVLSFSTVTPVGVTFGKTTTSTFVSTWIVSVSFVYVTVAGIGNVCPALPVVVGISVISFLLGVNPSTVVGFTFAFNSSFVTVSSSTLYNLFVSWSLTVIT